MRVSCPHAFLRGIRGGGAVFHQRDNSQKSANFIACYPHYVVVMYLAQKSERYYNDFMLS